MREAAPVNPDQTADDVIASARLDGRDVAHLRPLLVAVAAGEVDGDAWIAAEVARLRERGEVAS